MVRTEGLHPAIAGDATWQRAAREYIDRLREHYADQLATVVLYGSRARGDCDAYSDIDLLVVLCGEFDERAEQQWASQQASEVGHQHDYVLIGSIVATEHDYRRRMLPLFMNIRREGIELWPTEAKGVLERRGGCEGGPTKGDLRTIVAKAGGTLREAEHALANQLLDLAVNRAYYAMFHAATALLLKDGLAFSRHRTVIAEFNRRYVNTGRFIMPVGVSLDQAFDARNTADYAYAERVSHEATRKVVQAAEAFVAETERLLDL